MTDHLRIAIVGLGFQGSLHLKLLHSGAIPRTVVTAVVDPSASAAQVPSGLRRFTALSDCIAARVADAVIIATPHLHHCRLAAEAMRAGLHVLVEKPVAVSGREVQSLMALRDRLGPTAPVLAALHNQRTNPLYARLHQLIHAHELGRIHRVVWLVNDWFRSNAYYRSSPWRGTWAGEGGGVLVNQAVHQLDLWCWLFGSPERVRAWCRFGAWHDIEVEDDVTCMLAMPGGASGVFITSTGDSPGVNRLEIDCDRGRVVAEKDTLTFHRTAVDIRDHTRTSSHAEQHPPTETRIETLPDLGRIRQLVSILADFTASCLDGRAPLAPVEDAALQVGLANALLVSAVEGRDVELPLEPGRFDALAQAWRDRECKPGDRRNGRRDFSTLDQDAYGKGAACVMAGNEVLFRS